MPDRLVRFDLVDRLSPFLPEAPSQILIAAGCSILAIMTRSLVDLVFPGAGPFALTFPFVLLAALFGRWGAGLGVMLVCALYAWYVVLPAPHSFAFENPSDGPRVVINVLSGCLIVALAEWFRRVVRRAIAERDAIAEDRRLLLEEIDHRVRNNFAMVSAIIRLEAGSSSEEVADALRSVGGRVDSIARAHEALYRGDGDAGLVAMRPYLSTLCTSLDAAYFEGAGVIRPAIAPIALPRDRAVAIGLVVNELCTNAAKHAFPSRSGPAAPEPRIEVNLVSSSDAIIISVGDNGVGFPAEPPRPGSLGQGLVTAFAQQAGGALERLEAEAGTLFRMKLPV